MKFNDLDEATQYIINNMSDSEKEMIKKADSASIHMALARWANTQYISDNNCNIKELVLKEINPEKGTSIHNDNIVGIFIDRIIEKIKQ